MKLAYLLILLVSLGCMMLIDRRFSLFFWRDARRASWVLGLGVLVFVLWDVAGIALGIFLRGNNEVSTGLMLGPEFPIEELFFLIFLCYLTMVVFQGSQMLLARIARPRRPHPQSHPHSKDQGHDHEQVAR